jgi:hypothetical protein
MSDRAKFGLCDGWGNTVKPTSLSYSILKTDYTHAIWQNLMKLYYPRWERSKLMYTKYQLSSSFQSLLAEIKMRGETL